LESDLSAAMSLSTKRGTMTSPSRNITMDFTKRLHKCWEEDIDWKLIPDKLKMVSYNLQILSIRLFTYACISIHFMVM